MNDREVELVISHAKHYLRRSHPDFDALLALLEQARATKTLVAVTETEAHDIIDVRPLAGDFGDSVRAVARGGVGGRRRRGGHAGAGTADVQSGEPDGLLPRRAPPSPAFRSTTRTMAAGPGLMRCAG